jgi:cyanophycinase-like exopeptidase
MTRLLTLMGSGETAPTMVKVHRALMARAGAGPAVMLDTPFGFQENADDLTAKAQEYFARSVGHPIGVATWRSADAGDLAHDTLVARIHEARYVFAGPGSPTYALRQWAGTRVPDLLVERVERGGAVTFASAAALTTGVVTVPVYEIYKAGEDPTWRSGLNLLERLTGLRAAVIPHYDNAEGGHHDTRFCYLGERRLALLEQSLPEGAFVLGVDEHTAVTFDLDAGTATVVGLGNLTVRHRGASIVHPTGAVVAIDALADDTGHRGGSTPDRTAPGTPATADTASVGRAGPGSSLFRQEVDTIEAAVVDALDRRDARRAVDGMLTLERTIEDWSRDSLQSDDADRARSTLRSLVVRLGELAEAGAGDPRERLAPFVELLLAQRAGARRAKDFAASDAIRDGLAAAGVEVRDTPTGQEWVLR